jgi:hypothetical protein
MGLRGSGTWNPGTEVLMNRGNWCGLKWKYAASPVNAKTTKTAMTASRFMTSLLLDGSVEMLVKYGSEMAACQIGGDYPDSRAFARRLFRPHPLRCRPHRRRFRPRVAAAHVPGAVTATAPLPTQAARRPARAAADSTPAPPSAVAAPAPISAARGPPLWRCCRRAVADAGAAGPALSPRLRCRRCRAPPLPLPRAWAKMNASTLDALVLKWSGPDGEPSMDKPNVFINVQNFKSLIGPGFWHIQDLPPDRAEQVRPFLLQQTGAA